jgi:hypothetical protein
VNAKGRRNQDFPKSKISREEKEHISSNDYLKYSEVLLEAKRRVLIKYAQGKETKLWN